MPKRYSPEIRRTALELVNQGQTQIEVAQALGVSPKTLSHWVTTTQARMPDQQRNELEELKRLRLQVRKQQAEIDFWSCFVMCAPLSAVAENRFPE